jgi:hypothetical protein
MHVGATTGTAAIAFSGEINLAAAWEASSALQPLVDAGGPVPRSLGCILLGQHRHPCVVRSRGWIGGPRLWT